MKAFIDEYLQAIMYTICGLLLILGSYNILINVNHFIFINKRVVVSEIDSGYKNYQNNILEIENNLLSFKGDKSSKLYAYLNNVLSLLKQDGLYRMMPGDEIGYESLYKLNTYFIETLINNGWTSQLKNALNNPQYDQMVNYLVNNANYMNNELLSNSNFQYELRKNNVRDALSDEYKYILNNYQAFSDLILDISRKMVN